MAMRLDDGADELTDVHDINVTPCNVTSAIRAKRCRGASQRSRAGAPYRAHLRPSRTCTSIAQIRRTAALVRTRIPITPASAAAEDFVWYGRSVDGHSSTNNWKFFVQVSAAFAGASRDKKVMKINSSRPRKRGRELSS
jgi:hypothetical protein